MLRTYRDRAIVLRTYKLGEADRIVVLLGQTSGQIRAVAKGVRRTNSKFGARLGPFNVVDVQLHRGRHLDTVTQVEMLGGYAAPLGADYEGFTAAKVMAEATQKLTEDADQAGAEYFGLLHGAIGSLAARRHPPRLITASFLLRLMSAAGWPPALEGCTVCGAPLAGGFAPDLGGTVCGDCSSVGTLPLSEDGRLQMRALAAGDWAAASALPETAGAESLRSAVAWTQYHLEQKLRSYPFLAAI